MLYVGIGLVLGTVTFLYGQAFRFQPLPAGPRGVPVATGVVPWLVGGVRPNELTGPGIAHLLRRSVPDQRLGKARRS